MQDTGIGIPPDKQTLIFTRFERLHPAYQNRYPGFGLGLALVKQFITELDGEISVNSVENQGTTFTVLISLRESLAPKHLSSLNVSKGIMLPPGLQYNNLVRDPVAHSMTPASLNQRILVVEDNPIVQKAVQHRLINAGFQVGTADDGAQALTQVKCQDYEMVVMDLGLPDQDGCTVAKEIQRWQQHNHRLVSLIVALSAHLDEEIRQRCLTAGMVNTFVKPLEAQTVQEIADLLKPQKQKKQMPRHSFQINKNKTNKTNKTNSFTRRSRHG